MPTPNELYYITVPTYRGYIAALQLYAPIVSPLGVTKAQLQQMLLSGVPVYLYDRTTKSSQKITLQDFAGSKSIDTTEKKSKPIEPAKEAKQLTGAPVTKAAEKPATMSARSKKTEAETETHEESTKDETSESESTTTETADAQASEELIDESTIDWQSLTKAERRALRAKIKAQQAALAEKEAASSTESTTTDTPETDSETADSETTGDAETVDSTETTQSTD